MSTAPDPLRPPAPIPEAPRSREDQKLRTGALIRAAALDLIEEVGFERASIDEIAARAGVGRRTFFRYFPCKEAVLFEGTVLPGIPQNIDACLARGESPLHAAFSSLRGSIAYPTPPTQRDVRRRRLRLSLLSVPSVSAYYRTAIAELAREITETVRRHPQHAAVPMLPEITGGLIQIVLLEHVDSGEIAHLRVDEAVWRRALTAALG
ncbi:TetR/AcrR family transcriptional regulator [Mycetocola spongiae]|uniref:TetR/AcrR family transcriptional regulator n=1 Tax=Mycetocola spongiae TaxID=2859226 RepID=UPI001CF0FE39|nr:TetR/AcrR family transcriptional regulator [Mycetocola spongiae]UCR89463.1 TetR/AcrR family transcriptional regulator [Mycetocola spongiae]